MNFIIYTDGGCSGNKRNSGCIGAYAFIIFDSIGNQIEAISRSDINVTNNMMELKAAIEAMKILIIDCKQNWGSSKLHDCLIISDSKYLCDGATEYLPEWKKYRWRKSGGGQVINIEYWKELDKLTLEFNSVRFQWVKGHSKENNNIVVDRMVNMSMELRKSVQSLIGEEKCQKTVHAKGTIQKSVPKI